MKVRIEEPYPGAEELLVYARRNKEPHFVIAGSHIEDIDPRKVADYLNECDWTDRGSPGWVTPRLYSDDFLKD